MNRLFRALVLAVLASLALARGAAAAPPDPVAAAAARPKGVPMGVTLGFYIFDVRDVDLKGQKFYADFYMWMRYPALPEAESATAAEVEKFEFMNGKAESKDELDRKTLPSGETYICWRIAGTFHFAAQLRNYPFDTQNLELIVEHPSKEIHEVVYQSDAGSYQRSGAKKDFWGAKEDLDIPEFTLKGTDQRPRASEYKTDFGDTSKPEASKSVYSRFVFSMKFTRDFMPYFFKIIIPLIVIMAMAYLVFFLPAKEIQSASGLSITALLSCIAFNITVSQNLPEVGYLVVSDKFFLCTYILLFLTLLQSVLTYAADDAGKDVSRWDNLSRIVFPILYVSAFAYLLVQALTAN